MFQSPEGAAALLSATGEFSINGQRLSAAAAARVRRSVRAYTDEPITDDEILHEGREPLPKIVEVILPLG